MPKILTQLNVLLSDLRNAGWYFRAWMVLAIVCGIVGFTALIEISTESSSAAREKDWALWIENVSTLSFPDFEVQTANTQNAIKNVRCFHDSTTAISTTSCTGLAQSVCLKVLASSQTASSQSTIGTGSTKINCVISTANNDTNTINSIVAVNFASSGLEGDDITIKPTYNAWILLNPVIITNAEGKQVSTFRKQLVYHSSKYMPGSYVISIVINSFHVMHLEQSDSYNGWQAVADIGGFAYFLLIIHTILMMIVGIFLQNNSSWLLGRDPMPTTGHTPGLSNQSSNTTSENPFQKE